MILSQSGGSTAGGGGWGRRSGFTRVPQYGDTREFTEKRADAEQRKLA